MVEGEGPPLAPYLLIALLNGSDNFDQVLQSIGILVFRVQGFSVQKRHPPLHSSCSPLNSER